MPSLISQTVCNMTALQLFAVVAFVYNTDSGVAHTNSTMLCDSSLAAGASVQQLHTVPPLTAAVAYCIGSSGICALCAEGFAVSTAWYCKWRNDTVTGCCSKLCAFCT